MQCNREYINAPFFTRLIAYWIDLLIVSVLTSMFLGIALFSKIMQTEVLFHYTLAAVLGYVIKKIYFVGLTYANGRTFGKHAMGLAVMNIKGEKLRLIDILFRETIGRFLSGFGYIGYLLALGREHRALHDLLSDTRVCYHDAYVETRTVVQMNVPEQTSWQNTEQPPEQTFEQPSEHTEQTFEQPAEYIEQTFEQPAEETEQLSQETSGKTEDLSEQSSYYYENEEEE